MIFNSRVFPQDNLHESLYTGVFNYLEETKLHFYRKFTLIELILEFIWNCLILEYFCIAEYHCKCIDPWLLNNRRQCPVCKRKVIPGDSSDDEATVQSSNTTPHRSASNISESTPLLASSVQPSQSGLPLQNDILVTQAGPPRLVNVEFLSDDEEDYDGDTEEAHDNAGMVHDEVYPSTSGLAHSVETFKESPGEGEATTAVKVEDEPDVPLISLTDSRTVNV